MAMTKHLGTPEYRETLTNWNSPIPDCADGTGSFTGDKIREWFGNNFLAHPLSAADCRAMDHLQFFNSIDLATTYGPRQQPIFAEFITGEVSNQRGSYLTTVVAPTFQTNEFNFTTVREEFAQVACDEGPEGFIAREGSSTKWGWHDQLIKTRFNQTVSADLALDNYYGMQTMMKNLKAMASNVSYHVMRNIINATREIAYGNLIFDNYRDEEFDVSRLYAAEAEGFHIFAKNPQRGFEMMLEKALPFNGNLAIIKERGSKYLSRIPKEEPREIPAKILTYNHSKNDWDGQPIDGPQAFLTYKFGDAFFDIVEQPSWVAHSRTSIRENPLSQRLTTCQYYPPNPNFRADDEVDSNNPDGLAMWIYHQTKTMDGDVRISFADMLKNCFRWNEDDGKHSQWAISFRDIMNNRKIATNEIPFQYKNVNTSDINDDNGDNDHPTVAQLDAINHAKSKDTRLMKSVREQFVGLTYDPIPGEYRLPERIGDYTRESLGNGNVMRVVRSLKLKFESECSENLVTGLTNLYNLLDNIKRSPLNDDAIQALIDANMPADRAVPEYNDNGVLEMKLNKNHSLNLPEVTNDDARVLGMRYFNGFHSGPGLLTAKDELLKKSTNFSEMAKEAQVALDFLDVLYRFIKKYIGDSDVINPAFAADWFQFKEGTKSKDAILATMVDSIYGTEGPVFLGIPGVDGIGQKARETSLAVYLSGKPLSSVEKYGIPRNGGDTLYGKIDAYVRGLSLLSVNTGEKYKEFILAPVTKKPYDFTTQITELINYITTYEPKKSAEENKAVLNAVTDKFFSIALNTVDKRGNAETFTAALSWLEILMKPSVNGQKELKELSGGDAYKDKSPILDERVKEWERETAKANNKISGEIKNNKFKGGYTDAGPIRYVRTPMISSEALREYVVKQKSVWALPGDPNSNYTTPILNPDLIEIDSEEYREMGLMSHFGGLSARHSILSAHLAGSSSLTPHYEADSVTEESLFSLGAKYGDSRQSRYSFEEKRETKRGKKVVDSVIETVKTSLQQVYFGPWKYRIDFQEDIDDRLERFFFKAVIEAPDTLFTHINLSKIGAKLVNVMLFRPFIESFSSSMIIMRAGESTISTPISRMHVDISKEDRGFFHLSVSFYTGIVRVDPSAIQMILGAMPDTFVGGKGIDFVKKPSQFLLESHLRPSIVAICTPVTENIYDPVITMDGGKGIARPDSFDAHWQTKWSSAGFFCHLIGQENVNNISSMHQGRKAFGMSVGASFVAHKGPQSFINPKTKAKIDYNGTGPGGDRCMNMDGAYKVWNGDDTWYPTVYSTILSRERSQ